MSIPGDYFAAAHAKMGASIVFTDINRELVDKRLNSYHEAGITVRGYVCDVTDITAVVPVEERRKVIDIDLTAPFIVSKAVITSRIKKGEGKIINICSIMSELGRETVSAYAAAKGCILAYIGKQP